MAKKRRPRKRIRAHGTLVLEIPDHESGDRLADLISVFNELYRHKNGKGTGLRTIRGWCRGSSLLAIGSFDEDSEVESDAQFDYARAVVVNRHRKNDERSEKRAAKKKRRKRGRK